MSKINRRTTIHELAGIVSAHLSKNGIDAVLVGGAVVTIYSENEYQSGDLDFISPVDHRRVTGAMKELGFEARGKMFVHKNCSFTVEFPSGPLAIGNKVPVKAEGNLSTKYGRVKLLSPTQCVMDRLAWFYHSNDRQCLDQALAVAAKNLINLSTIKKWSEGELAVEKYKVFLSKLDQK